MILAALFWLKGLTFFAANVGDSCKPVAHAFFFLPTWWEYLTTKIDALGECSPVFTFPGDILNVGLALLDMLLRVAGFAAVISIVIAGAQYILANGVTDKAAAARRRLYNSLIGLAIALTATALVTFVGNQLVK